MTGTSESKRGISRRFRCLPPATTDPRKMAGPWTFALCGLLAATLVRATLSPAAVLSLSPEVIEGKLTQKLKDHDAVDILWRLPLLSTMREKPAGGNPILGSLVTFLMKYIIWLKVTSANILQLQIQPSADGQELVVKVPLDMAAGFNMPLVKSIVEMHMETEAQAIIRVETSERGGTLVLRNCSNSQGSLRLSLLRRFSFLVNSLADKVMSFLLPTLPTLVKSQLCPVIEAAFEDMREDLLRLVRVPISLSSGHLQFDLLSPAIKHDVIQLHLQAELSDSQGKVTKWFNESAVSLTMPTLEGEPFSLTIRQDVVNAAVATLVPPEELMVLLDYVLPELALRLKSSIKVINEKAADQLGPTQIVKIVTQETPELLLDQGRAKVAQLIVLEVFATSEVRRPFFTLGIEASSEAQFYTKGDQLTLNLNEISANRIHLMNSGIGLFDPELLKDITAEMLTSALLPNENGKLSSRIPVSMVKALGFEAASCSLTNSSVCGSSGS
ncbi:BPI fold-containing family B member 1-like isoform X2 [Equus quagga]|uniref:BPI fold-containing family B member 1-like isoform X2 n=1 Tax=Equus quagga TaxID=89248 RepID=UPI001EE272C9|nr:BPI fold-containing family B member 1-like isoform X2 [Equus quagga]